MLGLHARRGLLLAGGLLLTSCQLVSGLSGLESGSGGAGGVTTTSSGAPSSSSAASTTGSGGTGPATTTGGGGSDQSSASSGTGGAPSELTPCGGVTDSFNTLDANVWTEVGSVQAQNGKIVVNTFGMTSGLRLTSLTSYHECYASIRVLGGSGSTEADLLVEHGGGSQFEEIALANSVLSQKPTTMASLNLSASYLGIAFHGAKVYFLYQGFQGWAVLASMPRALWMDNADNAIGFGLSGGLGGSRNFDDFNVKPIVLADLPP